MTDDVASLIISPGSTITNAGFAGDDAPRSIIPTVLGRPSAGGPLLGAGSRTYYGQKAYDIQGNLALTYPIQRGLIQNWDDWEGLLFDTMVQQLRVAPEEHPTMLTEPAWNPKEKREKMAEVMFEKMGSQQVHVANQPGLVGYAAGRSTALVLSIGDGVTSAVPLQDKKPIQEGIVKVERAGGELTDYLMRLLMDLGYSFTTSAERLLVQDIKEKLGYVALDFEAEMVTAGSSSSLERSFELPDGQVITIGAPRFQCGEGLFQPGMLGAEGDGIAKMVYDSIMKCNEDVRAGLFGGILLAGGSTMFPGIAERLEKEIKALAPAGTEVKVLAPPERKYSEWVGGSILASLSTFDQWVTSQEYQESGASIVHQKCVM